MLMRFVIMFFNKNNCTKLRNIVFPTNLQFSWIGKHAINICNQPFFKTALSTLISVPHPAVLVAIVTDQGNPA